MHEDVSELKVYWRILLSNWWLLLLGLALGIAVALFTRPSSPPVYQASAKILVHGGQSPGIATAGDIQTSQQLADTYRGLITMRPVMEQTIERLSLRESPESLTSSISSRVSNSIIEVIARRHSSQEAADVASATAQVFVDQVRDWQLTAIARFQAAASQYGISSSSGSIASAQASAVSTMSIIEPAKPPRSPLHTSNSQRVIFGAVLGLVVALGVALLRDHMDDRIKSPENFKEIAELPVLGVIPFNGLRGNGGALILDDKHGRTSSAEPYKFLITNMKFSAIGSSPLKLLLVTSAVPKEGKTTMATNLAVSLARQGSSVVIVDADFHIPQLARIFKIENHPGLTDVLVGGATLKDALVDTAVPGLKVLTTGPLPPNSIRVLQSELLPQLFDSLKTEADYIIVDAPPVLAVADPLVMAPLVDGVIVVADVQHTSRQTLRRAMESLKQASPKLLGGVLNKVPSR